MAFVDLFRSKLLAVAGVVLFVTCLATMLAALSPFWYVLKLDYTHGSDPSTGLREIHVGLYFMDESRFINTIMIEKVGNEFFLPHMMRLGQLFFLLGTTGIVVICAAAFILGFRSYTSVTGEICLAAGSVPIVLSLIIGVALAALSPQFEKTWNGLPVPDPVPDRYGEFFLQSAEPSEITYDWGFFVAALAAGVATLGVILLWIQAISTCKVVNSFRYRHLHSRHPEDVPAAPIVYRPARGAQQPGRFQPRRTPPSKNELDL